MDEFVAGCGQEKYQVSSGVPGCGAQDALSICASGGRGATVRWRELLDAGNRAVGVANGRRAVALAERIVAGLRPREGLLNDGSDLVERG